MNLETLRNNYKDSILLIAAQYGVTNVRVFGSVARNEQKENSDIDFLVTTLPGTGLLKLAGFYNALLELLKCKIDIATDGKKISPNKTMEERIAQEAVVL